MAAKTGSCFRFLLLVFNYFTLITSVVLIAFSGYVMYSLVNLELQMLIPGFPLVTLALGIYTFALGTVGCFSAYRTAPDLVIWYSVMLAISLLCNFICGGLMVTYNQKMKADVGTYISKAIHDVQNGLATSEEIATIRHFQQSLDCCGFNSYKEWSQPHKYCCNSSDFCLRFRQKPCNEAAAEKFPKGAFETGIGVLCLSLTQVGALVCAIYHAINLRKIIN